MVISNSDLLSLITKLITRNPNLGIQTLEDELFVNLLIFGYLYIEIGGTGSRSVARES